jgi:predicted DNA-binding transcriptional regulator YafY
MKEFSVLDRHEYILRKIRNNEKIDTVQFAKDLKVNRKTIERDLTIHLSPLFEQGIKCENKIWIATEPIIDIIYYSSYELASIALLFKNISKDNPALYTKTIELFNQLHEKVSNAIYKQSSVEDILATHKKEFYLLKGAIEEQREITLEFFSHHKNVHPLKIANIEKYWYLLCHDLQENRFSKYPINGIDNIKIIDNKFDMKSYKYINELDNAINAFYDPNIENKVVLKLSWEAKKVLSRKILNSTQKIHKNENDEYIMKITVSNLMEISPLIQQWIPHIQVIQPKELKSLIRKNLENYEI